MPRDFPVTSSRTLLFGKGHQSPPWQVWASDLNLSRIPALQTSESIDSFESKNNCTCPPTLVLAYARSHGLSVTKEQAKNLLELRKAWREQHVLPEPPSPPDSFHIDISSDPPEGGGVSPPTGDFPLGGLSLRAQANGGYRFECWTGDCEGKDNPTTVVVDSDKTIIAKFEERYGS